MMERFVGYTLGLIMGLIGTLVGLWLTVYILTLGSVNLFLMLVD